MQTHQENTFFTCRPIKKTHSLHVDPSRKHILYMQTHQESTFFTCRPIKKTHSLHGDPSRKHILYIQTHQENTFFTCRPIKKTHSLHADPSRKHILYMQTHQENTCGHCLGRCRGPTLHNGVTCPARTLARQSNKDGSGPAMVILGPLSNTGIIHISVSTMTVKFPAMDSEVL